MKYDLDNYFSCVLWSDSVNTEKKIKPQFWYLDVAQKYPKDETQKIVNFLNHFEKFIC